MAQFPYGTFVSYQGDKLLVKSMNLLSMYVISHAMMHLIFVNALS